MQSERPDTRRLTIVRPGVVYGLAERGNFTRPGPLREAASSIPAEPIRSRRRL